MKLTGIRKLYLLFPALILLFIPFSGSMGQEYIPDSIVIKRIQVIQKMLDDGKPGADRWWNGWLIGYSVATVGQGIVYYNSDELRTRQDFGIGAVTTFLGVIGQVIAPMTPGYAPGRIRKIPFGSPEENRNKLQYAEEMLKKSYLREKIGRSWQAHALTLAVNMGTGLVVWLGFNRTFMDGLVNFAENTVITEVQIWTQPTRAIKDYKNYNMKYHPGQVVGWHPPRISWYVNAGPNGAQIGARF
jgi:hypothetical protein